MANARHYEAEQRVVFDEGGALGQSPWHWRKDT
jgi:hypothetical protein